MSEGMFNDIAEEIEALQAVLRRVLEWPVPQGTVEDYVLPKWLAKEARAQIGESE